jgi:hypothetical protein
MVLYDDLVLLSGRSLGSSSSSLERCGDLVGMGMMTIQGGLKPGQGSLLLLAFFECHSAVAPATELPCG